MAKYLVQVQNDDGTWALLFTSSDKATALSIAQSMDSDKHVRIIQQKDGGVVDERRPNLTSAQLRNLVAIAESPNVGPDARKEAIHTLKQWRKLNPR